MGKKLLIGNKRHSSQKAAQHVKPAIYILSDTGPHADVDPVWTARSTKR